ncbi:MAG: CZB domain-containing protein [Bdellovibrionaceae bacterium]|nr:CZB domain-containing protein [Pseudobdellovibrionaceae bacterium]
MDFDEAIKAHSAWKMKLSNYIKKPDGSLKVADVQVDNKCQLGQWIYGEGAKYSSMPEYQKLKTEHARFHKAAASVVMKADTGQDTSEEVALGAKSEFAMASSAVVSAIMEMKRKAGAS